MFIYQPQGSQWKCPVYILVHDEVSSEWMTFTTDWAVASTASMLASQNIYLPAERFLSKKETFVLFSRI